MQRSHDEKEVQRKLVVANFLSMRTMMRLRFPTTPSETRSDASCTVRIDGASSSPSVGEDSSGERETTIATCGLFGPVEAKSGGGAGKLEANLATAWERAGVEIYYKTFSQSSSPQHEHFVAALFRDLLERSVKLDDFPRAVLSITLRVMCENREGCGGITASSVALAGSLLYSGVALTHVPIVLECTLGADDGGVYFPGDAHFNKTDVIVSFLDDTSSPASLVTRVPLTPERLRDVLKLASGRARTTRLAIFEEFEKHAKANSDLF